ncbi:MAG: lactoylglutathione lyase [Nannocystales bacterium]
MLRVGDLERSLAFYVDTLGMKVVRREEYPQGRFTLAFVGYSDEAGVTLELTYNWGAETPYVHGTGFGHVAIAVGDIAEVCERVRSAGFTVSREPGPMAFRSRDGPPEHIAFLRDPDGYVVELVQR